MDLRDYLAQLESTGELIAVKAQVSCDLELPALCRREFHKPTGGKALLFCCLPESGYQLAANLFGSEARLLRLLRSSSLNDFASSIREYLSVEQPDSIQYQKTTLNQTGLLAHAAVDLSQLPALRSWPGETGGYLTLALTVTAHPETGQRNVGLYRAQVKSANQIALNFAPGAGADQHLQAARRLQQDLPVALILGGDPAWLWAAAAPLPAGWDEFSFCSDYFASDDRFFDCVSQPLEVPANAELVIEGQIAPAATCSEGPFGNHSGEYVSRADCPLLTVTAVLQKPEPILPMTVVGPPPSENINLAKANEVLIRETLRIRCPQVVDLRMPLETFFHGACLISVRSEDLSGHHDLLDYLWRESPLKNAKFILLVDEDIDLNDFSHCWWRAINRLQGDRIYQRQGQLALDATGVDPTTLVRENQQTLGLLNQRKSEYKL